MKKDNRTANTGITFLDLLQLLFIALKLMGYIDWSWWAVLTPFWISIIIILVVLFMVWVKII